MRSRAFTPDASSWIGVLLGAACMTGLAVTIGAWTPENLWGVPLASEAYGAHGRVASIVLSVGLLIALRSDLADSSLRVGRIAATISASAVLYVAATWVLRRAATDVAVVGALQAAAGALVVSGAVPLALAPGPHAGSLGLCLAGMAGVVSGVKIILGDSSLVRAAFEVLAITSVAALAESARDAARCRFAYVALVALVVLRAILGVDDASASILPAVLTAASWFAFGGTLIARAWRNAPIVLVQPHAVAIARLALSLAGPSLVLRAFLASLSRDIHLHETTFTMGAVHMETFVVMLAWLAFLMRDREPRPRARRGIGAVVALIGLGAHGICWSMVVLGARGMPKRYTQYLDRFQPLHQVTALAAASLILGLVLLLASTRARERPAVQFADVFA